MNTFRNIYKVRYGHSKTRGMPYAAEEREFANAQAASRFRNRYLSDAKIRGDSYAFAEAEKSIDGGDFEEI